MTTSPERAGGSWSSQLPEPEYDTLQPEYTLQPGYEPLQPGDEPLQPEHDPDSDAEPAVDNQPSPSGATAAAPRQDDQDEADDRTSKAGVRVGEYAAMPGLPGRAVVLVSLLAVVGCAALDLRLTSRVTMFFDLCFVVVCLVAAMAVRRRDLFTTGVLPPLVFAVVVAGIALWLPSTFVPAGGLSRAFLTGLAEHATGLVAGYAVALVTVGGRVAASRQR